MVIVDPKITAKTERLFLRPLAMEDASDIVIMRASPEVMLHSQNKASEDIEKTKAWIQGCHNNDNCWNFSIELLPTSTGEMPARPRVIGLIGAVRAPEVGYMLNTNYWGKGYATEALRAFMPLFFDYFSGNGRVRFEFAEAHTDPTHISSQNVMKKVGFKLFELREKDFENPVLGWRDTVVYRLYRPVSVHEGANGTRT